MTTEPQDKPAQPHPSAPIEQIDEVLSGLRVPNLPYPVGKLAASERTDWLPLLMSCWTEQRDERVTRVIDSVSLTWTVRQVNSAYVADRIMDVFLKTSGLNPVLAARVARLRFLMAWQLDLHGSKAFSGPLAAWLENLRELRGWSDSGGRSARRLLDQLDGMVLSVSACFQKNSLEPFEAFCQQWSDDATRRQQQVERLTERLLETEQGAARQRCTEQASRALVARAVQGRRLPDPVLSFIRDRWMPLLRQVVWEQGMAGEQWRHAGKILEWLVWVGDPTLSDQDQNRLYQVGEKLVEHIADVWKKVMGKALTQADLSGVESVLVARVRGDSMPLIPAREVLGNLEADPRWLALEQPDPEEVREASGNWYVEGEGRDELRRYFSRFLDDTREVLWTNGAGVKLGLMPWSEFQQARGEGRLNPLPPLNPFGQVLHDTLTALTNAFVRQRNQRHQAAEEARKKAEAVRQRMAEEERQRQEQERLRQEELARQQQEREQLRLAEEEEERERQWQEQMELARKQVENIKLGGWIAIEPLQDAEQEQPKRMKLAIRINASKKLVFVDRLGLNRMEFLEDELVLKVASKEVRVLGSNAEFDDTLSRVVGRIRVGR